MRLKLELESQFFTIGIQGYQQAHLKTNSPFERIPYFS